MLIPLRDLRLLAASDCSKAVQLQRKHTRVRRRREGGRGDRRRRDGDRRRDGVADGERRRDDRPRRSRDDRKGDRRDSRRRDDRRKATVLEADRKPRHQSEGLNHTLKTNYGMNFV